MPCSASDTTWNLEILRVTCLATVLSNERKTVKSADQTAQMRRLVYAFVKSGLVGSRPILLKHKNHIIYGLASH